MDNALEEIFTVEKAKMKTFRILYDEKPTRQMLSIVGYSNIGKINKQNPNFIPPEQGGEEDPVANPESKYFFEIVTYLII